MKTLTVPARLFDTLARGDGGTAGVLRGGLYSRRLLLLHALEAGAGEPELRAFTILREAQKRSRAEADDVLLDPHVGAWATSCLRSIVAGEPGGDDRAHLGSVAAAAALRTGLTFEVETRIVDGGVVLPTLGMVRIDGQEGPCRIRSAVGAGGVEVVTQHGVVAVPDMTTSGDAGPWLPLRRVRCEVDGLALDVAIDDLGPYRDCGELAVTDRLDSDAFADWEEMFALAWAMLVRNHRQQAEAIAAGVATIVPLESTEAADELSATCHAAGGAVALTAPRQPLSAALALVHEFQHTKLTALLDVVPLLDPPPEKCLRAPWRPDPRPLSGLLQGTYAFLGLTRFWDVRRRLSEPPEPGSSPDRAEFEFELGRRQVADALETLRKAPELRSLGERFVDGMSDELARLNDRSVPQKVRRLARFAARDHAISWRLRNRRPDPDQVASMTEAWLDRRSFQWPNQLQTVIVDGGGPVASAGRLADFREWLAFRDRRSVLVHQMSTGDHLVLRGRLRAAHAAYAAALVDRPDDLASWSGLVLTSGRLRRKRTAEVLGLFPEWAVAVHRAIREQSETAPSPEDLAAWMAGD